MKEFFSKKVFSMTFTNLLFLTIGLMLAIGASVAYATWNDAKTGGSGSLSEANWNALVNMLETSDGGRPGNWVCSTVNGGNGATSGVTCPVGTNLIAGGCNITGLGSYYADFGFPNGNGWWCGILNSPSTIIAYARCCQ